MYFFFSLNCRYTYSFNKKRQECAPRPSKVAKKYARIGDLLEQCLVTRLESHVNINIHQHPSKQEMVYKLRYSYPERIFRKDFLFNIMITSCKFEADFLVIINVAAISLQSERQLLETKGKNSCKRVKVKSRQCRMAFLKSALSRTSKSQGQIEARSRQCRMASPQVCSQPN